MPFDPVALEHRAAAEASAGLTRRLRMLLGRALLLWDTVNDSQRVRAAEMLAVEVGAVSLDDVPPIVQTYASTALVLSVADAARRLAVPVHPVELTRAIRGAVKASTKGARKELAKASRLMRSAKTLSDVQAAMAVASRSVTRVDAAARFAVNLSLSEGVSAVSKAHGALDLWVAERDACLHCLAHQGHTVPAGGLFSTALTFARSPLKGARGRPPLHPFCRCRIVPHRPEWGTDYPMALKREAARSVLRGWSRPSESGKARLEAAAELLKRTTLPKSVQEYARRAVRRGAFPKGRTFPALPRGR